MGSLTLVAGPRHSDLCFQTRGGTEMVAEDWETLIQKESEPQSELRTFMSRGSRDRAHWKWERIRVASRTRSAPLRSLVAHHVQKKVRMGPGVAGRNRTTNCESGLVAAQVPTGKAGNRILRIGPDVEELG